MPGQPQQRQDVLIRQLQAAVAAPGGSGITWTPIDPTAFITGISTLSGDTPSVGWDDDFLYFRGSLQTTFKNGPEFLIMQGIPIPQNTLSLASPIFCENIGSADPNVPVKSVGYITLSTYMHLGVLVTDVYLNRTPTYSLSTYSAESFIFLSPAQFAWSP